MQPYQSDNFDLPAELCVKPLALIGTSGLDNVNNAVHKTIWDALSNNRRSDRAPLQFKLLNNAHEFPVLKPKRNSYEWYIPKGILKRNWMYKHLNEIPAVIVLFYDLDWNDIHWNEKLIECSSRVQSMRAAIEGRSTRIVVVLIQHMVPLPAGEDVLAAERATALCATCELNAKHLFVLPHGDHLHGYTARLENAFYDLAQGYYQLEARNIKAHRDHLNKTTHQYLYVRHQFKMGFLNELKQDYHTANKHYQHAYNNLQELRMVDTNAMEIKTVAGFINYKLCRILFLLNLARDAISQFCAHIERYKTRSGFRELTFEHHAWMSKQYSVFGDLFDEAIRSNLPAVQTQHPGFYYQQAAYNAVLRKQACVELCKNVTNYPSVDPLEGINRLEYYGQRPWRPGRLSAEPPDPALEQAAIQALQWREKNTVNHSIIIITLYGSAITQFKTYKCPRMRRHLVVQMADEYFSDSNFGKALTLLTHMIWDYRLEKWFTILATLLRRALCCAQLTASVQDFIILSVEALSDSILFSIEEKSKIHENLLKVLKKFTPESDSLIASPIIQNVEQLWNTVNIKKDPEIISIEMNKVSPCMQMKTRFTQKTFSVHENITIEIYIKSCSSQALQFSRLCVVINSPNYSSELTVSEGATVNGISNPTLWFQSNDVKKFLIQFKPNVMDVGKEIQISGVLLYLGLLNERAAVLKFTGNGSEVTTIDATYNEFQNFQLIGKDMLDFYTIKPRTVTQVVSHPSNVIVDIDQTASVLLGEYYPIRLCIHNNEGKNIKHFQLEVNLIVDESTNSEKSIEFCKTLRNKTEKVNLTFNIMEIAKDSSISMQFYLHASQIQIYNISLRITYLIMSANGLDYPCTNVVTLTVEIVEPFEFDCLFFSSLFEPISKLQLNKEFIIMPKIANNSPWPITIDNTTLELDSSVNIVNDNNAGQLNGVELSAGSEGSELYISLINKLINFQNSIGTFTVSWKRKGSKTLATKKKFILPVIPIEIAVMSFGLVLPPHGIVKTPISVMYHINNHSSELLQLNMNMEGSDDSFMYAGHKQKQISILPESKYILNYILYPLMPGNLPLPKLQLSLPNENDQLTQITQEDINELNKSLPQYIFVLPQCQGNSKSVQIYEDRKDLEDTTITDVSILTNYN